MVGFPSDNGSAQRQVERAYLPVLDMLFDELDVCGLPRPSAAGVHSPAQFTVAYLQAVQALEACVAGDECHAPMTRREVELMCRCALSAETLAGAMALLIDFAAMIAPRAGRLSLESCDSGYRFVHNSLRSSQSLASALVDITGLFAFKQLFQWLSGGTVVPNTVSIGPLKRNEILPFLHLFNIPVVATGAVYYLQYSAADLERPVVASAGAFAAFFEFFPCAVYTPGELPLGNQVSSLLSAAIRQSTPLPGLVQVARSLGLAPSTLRRNLAQCGTSFRELRVQCQYDAALSLLAETELGISDIADALGFRTPATFRRAFKRWSATAPTQYRNTASELSSRE